MAKMFKNETLKEIRKLMKLEKNDEAIKLAFELYKKFPNDKQVIGVYALAALKKDASKALGERLLLGLLKDESCASFVGYELGKFKEDEGEYYQARKYYLDVLNLNLNNPYKKRVLFRLVKFEFNAGNYEESLSYFDQLVDFLESENLRYMSYLEVTNENCDEYKKLKQRIEGNNELKIKALSFVGNIYYRTGNNDKAYEAFRQVATIEEKSGIYAMYYLGKIDLRREDYLEAKLHFYKVLKAMVNYKNAKIFRDTIKELGRANFYLRDYNEALYYFEQQKLFGGKDFVDGLFWIGKTYVALKDFISAKECFLQCIENGSISAMLELGKLESDLGNINDARTIFWDIIHSDKTADIDRCYGLNEIGGLEMNEGNFEEAREYFLQLQKYGNEQYLLALNSLIFIDIREDKLTDALFKVNAILDYNKNEFKFSSKTLIRINFYLKYRLGLLTDEEIESGKKDYICNQLVDYDESRAIEHGSCNRKMVNETTSSVTSAFYPGTNYSKLFYKVKEEIMDRRPNRISLVDKYIVKLDCAVGSFDLMPTNVVGVSTCPNTKEIISIIPMSSSLIDYNLDRDREIGYKKTLTTND